MQGFWGFVLGCLITLCFAFQLLLVCLFGWNLSPYGPVQNSAVELFFGDINCNQITHSCFHDNIPCINIDKLMLFYNIPSTIYDLLVGCTSIFVKSTKLDFPVCWFFFFFLLNKF